MRSFEPMVHGAPGWDEQYNNDMGLLFGEMAGAKANSVLNTYVHVKNGKAHTLTGEGAVMRFLAKAPWTAGDTISVNGVAKNPVTLEGTALPTGAFVAGMWVVAIIDGQKLQFLTQSYANTFAGIQTQLANKANMQSARCYPLPVTEGHRAHGGYYKNELGELVIQACITAIEGTLADRSMVAALPEGFRPDYYLEYPATYFPVNSLAFLPGAFQIIDGGITLRYDNRNGNPTSAFINVKVALHSAK